MAGNRPAQSTPTPAHLSQPPGFPDDSPARQVDLKSDSPADSDRSPTSGSRAAAGYAGELVDQGAIDPIQATSTNLSSSTRKSDKLKLPTPAAYCEKSTLADAAESIKPGHHLPPSRFDVVSSLSYFGLPSAIHTKPHCSRREDVGGGGLHVNETAAATCGKNQVRIFSQQLPKLTGNVYSADES